MGVLLVCWCVVGVLLVCCWYVGVLSACYCGVLLVCYWCLGSFTTVTTCCGTFEVIYKCHNALWQLFNIQNMLWQNIFATTRSVHFWALKTLNEQIRPLLLTYTPNYTKKFVWCSAPRQKIANKKKEVRLSELGIHLAFCAGHRSSLFSPFSLSLPSSPSLFLYYTQSKSRFK